MARDLELGWGSSSLLRIPELEQKVSAAMDDAAYDMDPPGCPEEASIVTSTTLHQQKAEGTAYSSSARTLAKKAKQWTRRYGVPLQPIFCRGHLPGPLSSYLIGRSKTPPQNMTGHSIGSSALNPVLESDGRSSSRETHRLCRGTTCCRASCLHTWTCQTHHAWFGYLPGGRPAGANKPVKSSASR